MYIEIFELDKNNLSEYTRDYIKNKYKKIALECHPDKLCNIKDENLKNVKTEKFKNACIAYKKAIDDFDNYGCLTNGFSSYEYNFDDLGKDFDMYNDMDCKFWNDIYDDFFSNKEEIEKTFIDVAKMFLSKGIRNKKYYNPSTSVIKHSIVLPLLYYDLINTKKKKLQITLKGVEELFNISILCKKEYPCLTRQYIDDNGVEHEIEIKMILGRDDEDKSIYKHIFNDNGTIDLITKININLYEYLSGTTKIINYIDGNCINLEIKPLNLNKIILEGKGLLGGKLIVNINYININIDEWNKLSDENKENILLLLKSIYK
jgi:DnaJ-class molecular chaperone